ncbi:hypothetical protein D0Y65_003431, partial [Glycine soja]
NQIKQATADSEQVVEMALLILNQEINKLQGVRKALSVLSKALDNDPSSVVLWFVYLLIYYGNLKPNEKDDMFLSAYLHCRVGGNPDFFQILFSQIPSQMSCAMTLSSASALLLATMDCFLLLQVTRFSHTKVQ